MGASLSFFCDFDESQILQNCEEIVRIYWRFFEKLESFDGFVERHKKNP